MNGFNFQKINIIFTKLERLVHIHLLLNFIIVLIYNLYLVFYIMCLH